MRSAGYKKIHTQATENHGKVIFKMNKAEFTTQIVTASVCLITLDAVLLFLTIQMITVLHIVEFCFSKHLGFLRILKSQTRKPLEIE